MHLDILETILVRLMMLQDPLDDAIIHPNKSVKLLVKGKSEGVSGPGICMNPTLGYASPSLR